MFIGEISRSGFADQRINAFIIDQLDHGSSSECTDTIGLCKTPVLFYLIPFPHFFFRLHHQVSFIHFLSFFFLDLWFLEKYLVSLCVCF